MAKGRNKANATGRSHTSRFARLDHRLLESPAYRSLSTNARALLVELTRMDNGGNNGALWLSVRDGAALMGVANTKSASAALAELQELGFIVKTKDAHFRIKTAETSRARCWRLTWLPIPKKQGPTNDYLDRQPMGRIAKRRMEMGLRAIKSFKRMASQNQNAVGELHTLPPKPAGIPVQAVGELPTARSENDGIPPKLIVGDLTTHIADQRARECEALFSLAWWQPNGLGPMIDGLASLSDAARHTRFQSGLEMAA